MTSVPAPMVCPTCGGVMVHVDSAEGRKAVLSEDAGLWLSGYQYGRASWAPTVIVKLPPWWQRLLWWLRR